MSAIRRFDKLVIVLGYGRNSMVHSVIDKSRASAGYATLSADYVEKAEKQYIGTSADHSPGGKLLRDMLSARSFLNLALRGEVHEIHRGFRR